MNKLNSASTPFPNNSKAEGVNNAGLERLIEEIQLLRKDVERIAKIQSDMLSTEDNLLYTTDQVAQLIAPSTKKGKPVSDTTILRWIKQKLIHPVPGSHYRISGKEIKRFVSEHYGKK